MFSLYHDFVSCVSKNIVFVIVFFALNVGIAFIVLAFFFFFALFLVLAFFCCFFRLPVLLR